MGDYARGSVTPWHVVVAVPVLHTAYAHCVDATIADVCSTNCGCGMIQLPWQVQHYTSTPHDCLPIF